MNQGNQQPRTGRRALIWVGVAAVVLLGAGGIYLKATGPGGAASIDPSAKLLPELSADAGRWVNGAPITVAESRGKVLLIEGWHPT